MAVFELNIVPPRLNESATTPAMCLENDPDPISVHIEGYAGMGANVPEKHE
jgi:hypothetical protein